MAGEGLRSFAIVAIGVATGSYAYAQSAPPPLPIGWSAPAPCPTLDDVRPFLEAIIPAEIRAALDDVTTTVTIEPSDQGFRAHVHVRRGAFEGDREVEGRQCGDVARSALVVVSVALTEAVRAETIAPAEDTMLPPPISEPPIETEPVEVAPPPAPTPPITRTHHAIGVDVGGGVTSGIGTRAVAPVLTTGVRVALSHGFTLGARVRVEPWNVVGTIADVRVATVAPELCDLYTPSRLLHVGGCVRVDVGFAVGKGEQVDSPRRDTAGWLAFGLSPSLEIDDTIRLRVALDGEARAVRPQVVVEGGNATSAARILAGGASLSVLFRIP